VIDFNGRSLAVVGALLLLAGCAREKEVELTLLTPLRTGQVVQDHFIEMQEGQAMGVRVVGMKSGQLRPDWSVEGRGENPSILAVRPSTRSEKKGDDDGERFVISGSAAGATQIRFRLDGRHDVYVDAIVRERPEWEPNVPPANFGGAGPE
jgi:hypothetical protein